MVLSLFLWICLSHFFTRLQIQIQVLFEGRNRILLCLDGRIWIPSCLDGQFRVYLGIVGFLNVRSGFFFLKAGSWLFSSVGSGSEANSTRILIHAFLLYAHISHSLLIMALYKMIFPVHVHKSANVLWQMEKYWGNVSKCS